MVWLLYLGYIIFACVNNASKLSEMACNICGGTGAYLKQIISVNSPATLVRVFKLIVLSFIVISVMSFNGSLLLLLPYLLHSRFKYTCFGRKLM